MRHSLPFYSLRNHSIKVWNPSLWLHHHFSSFIWSPLYLRHWFVLLRQKHSYLWGVNHKSDSLSSLFHLFWTLLERFNFLLISSHLINLWLHTCRHLISLVIHPSISTSGLSQPETEEVVEKQSKKLWGSRSHTEWTSRNEHREYGNHDGSL